MRALADYPDWAVQRGFDAWVKTGTRRPTPGEILILVAREVKPITDEIRRREQDEADRISYQTAPSDEELAHRREVARDVLQRAGYAKAERPTGPVKADVSDDDLAEMKAHLAAKGLA